ncbi:MAG: LamG-like jellyroll fold domain-containing protein, partial [Verrucomicrobiota bacterium]
GQMNLRANWGDTWTYNNRALNLFALNTPTSGDFMMTLGVSKFVPSLRDSPGIVLVAWDDSDNNARYHYGGGSGGRGASMSIESRQAMTSSAGSAKDFGTNAFAVRLVKQGNMYSIWASTNGTDFAAITNVPAAPYGNGLPRQVGFWMGLDYNQTDTMLIDYFEVSSLTMTNAGVRPVFASANLTGGLLNSPFAWEVNAAYATGFSAAGLPPGLSLASQNGRITGTPTAPGVYDSTITATNAFGATNQALRIVVRNTTGVLFREDFASGLSPNWTTVPTDTNYFTLLPGQMWYRADYGEAWSSINRPLHLYAVDVPTNGDFTATLAISEFVPNRADSPQVGLLAWKDTDNFVRSIYYGSASGPLGQGQLAIEQSGSPTATGFSLVFGDGPFLLRLQRANGVYTSSWSTNGVDFTVNPASAFSATFAPTKWGFYLGGDPTYLSVAVVDHFEVASGVPPAITSLAQAQAFQGQPFTWQVTTLGTALFTATGLPPGLGMDTNGLISGTPSLVGNFNVGVTASNHLGVATQALSLTVLWSLPTNNLPTNLVSWWRGETNAQDQMGVHNGTLGGGTTFTNGMSGRAFALNGANSSVELGTWFNLQQFTLSFWVKPEATQPLHADILDNNHNGTRSWVIQSLNTASGGKSQWQAVGVNFDLTIGVWQHLVVARDSNNISRLYLNGTLVATNAGTGAIYYDGTQNLHLGRHDSLGRYFNGQIDEFMCFNRPLDSNEVAYLAGTANPYAISIPGWLAGFGLTGTNA